MEVSREQDLIIGEEARISPTVVAALHAACAEELRLYLIGLLRNSELAQEALQASFGKLIEQGHTAQGPSLRGWLFRVAYHEAMLIRRQEATRDRSLKTLAGLLKQVSSSPEQEAARRETAERVRQELTRLPVEQQEVVRRRIHEGQTFAVIAHELNVPLGTVLTRMRSALERLKRALPPEPIH